MIKVVFFASLREALGSDGLELSAESIGCVQDVVAHLCQLEDAWRESLTAENVLIAVNQEMVKLNHPVRDSDEIAFFPPVTGG